MGETFSEIWEKHYPVYNLSFFSSVDSKDQKALERLREERQAKITELKERTNYYTTQQLIQVGFSSFYPSSIYLLLALDLGQKKCIDITLCRVTCLSGSCMVYSCVPVNLITEHFF